jgi:hypothetical protein
MSREHARPSAFALVEERGRAYLEAIGNGTAHPAELPLERAFIPKRS